MQPGKDNDEILDATGEECPVPVEMAADRLGRMRPGEVLRIRSTDPVSPIDFEAWCLRSTHEFLGVDVVEGVWEIRVRKGSE